jgi:rRNA maturation endonuclease Nob1
MQDVPNATTKASYTYEELKTAKERIREPFSKNLSQVFSTELHPHSQIRANYHENKMLNHSTIEEIKKERSVALSNAHFRTQLPITAPGEKYVNYVSQYKLNYTAIEDRDNISKGNIFAGDFNQNP